MPLFLRKSLRAGPLRFNLSKSGIGVSTGVPGLRIGLVGPRGHYVYAGRGGVYYRKSLNGRTARSVATPHPVVDHDPGQPPEPSAHLLDDVSGATVMQMAISSSGELVAQLTESAKMLPVWKPWAAVGLIVTAIVAIATGGVGIVLIVPVILASWWLRHWDAARRTVAAFYDVNDEHAQRAEALVTAFNWLMNTGRRSRVVSQGATGGHEWKVNAGASTLANTLAVTATLDGPPHLTTNVAVPSLVDAKRATYFLPDLVLIREGSTFAQVQYGDLQCHAAQVRWIEDGQVPGDAQQVGTTWRYVNKSGGPDRRFNNNRQLPILLYSDLSLAAPNGLHETYRFSNPKSAEAFAQALAAMGAKVETADALVAYVNAIQEHSDAVAAANNELTTPGSDTKAAMAAMKEAMVAYQAALDAHPPPPRLAAADVELRMGLTLWVEAIDAFLPAYVAGTATREDAEAYAAQARKADGHLTAAKGLIRGASGT